MFILFEFFVYLLKFIVGFTDPISTNPKPNPKRPSRHKPVLSYPEAIPKIFGK